jgi:DNA-binding response OmpR family regulator
MSQKTKKILVIDDEGIIRDCCVRALSARGYEVHTAADGKEGMKMITENFYDVIFLDLVMPDVDTKEVADSIRDLMADTRLVIFSGYDAEEAKHKAKNMGAALYLEKPFTPSDLVAAIKQVQLPRGT